MRSRQVFHLERAGGQCFTNISCFSVLSIPKKSTRITEKKWSPATGEPSKQYTVNYHQGVSSGQTDQHTTQSTECEGEATRVEAQVWTFIANPSSRAANLSFTPHPQGPPRLVPKCAPGCEFWYFRCSQENNIGEIWVSEHFCTTAWWKKERFWDGGWGHLTLHRNLTWKPIYTYEVSA